MAGPQKARELKLIKVSKISPHPKNPRGDVSNLEIEELANSIKRVGHLIHPIHLQINKPNDGRPDNWPTKPFLIISGARRWHAADYLGWDSIEAFVHRISDDEALRWMCEENSHRRNLSPISEAKQCALLRELGATNEEIAKRCGLQDASSISNKLRLLKLKPWWQLRVHSGLLGESIARQLLSERKQLDGRAANDVDVVLNTMRSAVIDDDEGLNSRDDFEDAITVAIAAYTSRADAAGDGPDVGPPRFFYRKNFVELNDRDWHVLKRVWDVPGRTLVESNLGLTKPAVKSSANRIREAFTAAGWPLSVVQRNGSIVLTGYERE